MDDFQYMSRISILYVEDEDEIRHTLTRFLQKRAREVHVASNGQEGLELFRKHRPHVVVTDIQMPVMDGLELARHIKAIDITTPIIITTAYDDSSFMMESIDLGIEKYIKKPLRTQMLFTAIDRAAQTLLQKRELEQQNRIIQAILDNSPGFIATFVNNQITYMNKSFLQYLGYTCLPDLMAEHSQLSDFFVEKDGVFYAQEGRETWLQQVQQNPDQEHIVFVKSPEQLKLDAQAYIVRANLISASANPDVAHQICVVTFANVTELEMEKQRFQELAMRDPLTDILNRKFFVQELEREIARSVRYNHTFSLVMFDIDRFKPVNDTYGHQVGDYVLKEVVTLVSFHMRRTDVFGRYGGEEFIILLPETGLEGACALAEKIRETIDSHIFDFIEHLTCSFGVAEFNNELTSFELIKRTDDALYKAKNNGRNRIEHS
ncbi:diguanylate cyclase [Desulfurispirillum indicum]|uniref:diguanylate cyclase n=1 Tax=Desulfurispirillum indicum (strain ATCC BAA-1389 / DSM 22839 / S5) TaxID=653733 RepID=E6W0C8_DESIS|nr:diguanylate cyclase [Desulfurispirillum indicum]ADU66346.1 diguanylate cyclase [Desulfurispirillum indicum S5]UCZ55680.1 diguanylate cyclase [Desulfurispirillum indicum]